MGSKNSNKELEVFHKIVSGLSSLEKDAQTRIIQSVATFLEIESVGVAGEQISSHGDVRVHLSDLKQGYRPFSDREETPPKNFLSEKEPSTDVERVACLAYYLTHYRETPHFKTLDISKLNTEAAQQKFSNPTQAMKNTERRGLLASVARGKKQLSATGEQFVEALPDIEAAKKVLRRKRQRRTRKASSKKRTALLTKR